MFGLDKKAFWEGKFQLVQKKFSGRDIFHLRKNEAFEEGKGI